MLVSSVRLEKSAREGGTAHHSEAYLIMKPKPETPNLVQTPVPGRRRKELCMIELNLEA